VQQIKVSVLSSNDRKKKNGKVVQLLVKLTSILVGWVEVGSVILGLDDDDNRLLVARTHHAGNRTNNLNLRGCVDKDCGRLSGAGERGVEPKNAWLGGRRNNARGADPGMILAVLLE
jgi:hypothetical protein